MFKSTEERIPCKKGDTVRNKKTKKKYIIFQSSYKSNLGKVIESKLWQNINVDGEIILIGIAGSLYNKDYQIRIQGKWLSI
jgi:hypothetical protein